MIEWYEGLIWDSYVGEKWDVIQQKIIHNELMIGIKLIVLSLNENNIFDIIDSNQLVFPYYQKQKLFVVGVARGQNSAQELACQMVMEVYRATGNFDVRSFLHQSVKR